jgi:hypothetical protein
MLYSEMKEAGMTAYVYIWFRPDWTPFYVGIGKTPSRWNPARAKDKDRNPLCMKIIRKYGAQNIHVQKHTGLSWSAACAKEQSLIAHFGRIDEGGLLANFTDGGEGAVNPAKHVIEASRARLLDPKHPMRDTHVWLNNDPKILERRNEAIRSQEVRAKHKKNADERWSDPVKRDALAEKMRVVWAERKAANPPKEKPKKRNKEELAEYRRNLLKERNADPEYRAKRVAAVQAASSKISAGVLRSQEVRLATLATPEVQAKLRRPKTEAHNRKVSEAKKLWWAKKKAESTN